MVRIGLILILSLVAFIALNSIVSAVTAGSGDVKEFNIRAAQFFYDPNVIEVNKGDRVILHLQSLDVSHGLYLDGYSLKTQAAPGEEATLQFVADKAGKFRYRCSVTCGALHPFMIGELIVRPNHPYTAALILTLVAALGTVAFVWWKREG